MKPRLQADGDGCRGGWGRWSRADQHAQCSGKVVVSGVEVDCRCFCHFRPKDEAPAQINAEVAAEMVEHDEDLLVAGEEAG